MKQLLLLPLIFSLSSCAIAEPNVEGCVRAIGDVVVYPFRVIKVLSGGDAS